MVLVSVGVPVRNGARTLRRALASIQAQSHRELEVLIADNASSDETERVCADFVTRDERFRYVRQAQAVTAVRNFRTTFEAAHGAFFMWAAHDDWRSPNYVECLLACLQLRSAACLAFSEIELFDDLEAGLRLQPLEFDFATVDLPLLERLRKTAQTVPFHIYGLMRREALLGYPWYEADFAPDWPVMQWLAARGEFARASGAQLFSYAPPTAKSEGDKARANALRTLGRFPGERIALLCADAAMRGAPAGTGLPRLVLAWRLYMWQQRGLRSLLYARAPGWLQRTWARLRGVRAR